MNNLKFFTDRIGKRIYREVTFCECRDCKHVAENGRIIMDENDARYLYEVSCDLEIEYYDQKQ
jgi:hypothetical protein